jgi:hypothetical protein
MCTRQDIYEVSKRRKSDHHPRDGSLWPIRKVQYNLDTICVEDQKVDKNKWSCNISDDKRKESIFEKS